MANKRAKSTENDSILLTGTINSWLSIMPLFFRCNKKQNTALHQQNSSTYPKGQCPRACKCCNQQHNQRNKIFAGMMPQIAFCFPITDWMLPFQNHRQNGALQGEYKKRPYMDKVKTAVYDLPTAKVNTGDNAVDCKSGSQDSSVQIGVFKQRIARPIGNIFSP